MLYTLNIFKQLVTPKILKMRCNITVTSSLSSIFRYFHVYHLFTHGEEIQIMHAPQKSKCTGARSCWNQISIILNEIYKKNVFQCRKKALVT